MSGMEAGEVGLGFSELDVGVNRCWIGVRNTRRGMNAVPSVSPPQQELPKFLGFARMTWWGPLLCHAAIVH